MPSPRQASAPTPVRPARLPMWLADQLEEALLHGEYPVGSLMPTEKAIADDFGVSRQVVREAARLLEDRGLVEIRAGRGMTVIAPNVDSIVQRFRMLLQHGHASFEKLMELRRMTEVDMATLAAANRTDDDVAHMRDAIARAAENLDDYAACMDADMAFHMAVARATQNPFVLAFVQPINLVLRDVYRKPIGYLATQADTVAEHTAIADAIAARDVEAARRATSAHLGRVVDDAGTLVDEDAVVVDPTTSSTTARPKE
ncbi:FadR/GntR family transcriptional regulator [Georgenia sp. Z1491]